MAFRRFLAEMGKESSYVAKITGPAVLPTSGIALIYRKCFSNDNELGT